MLKRAFTLIELLVVIAIIAILAAILFPVFAQAKAAAKHTVSLSNTKELDLANIMYAGDVDDMLPFDTQWNTGHDQLCYSVGCFSTWAWDAQPYIKNYQILADPLAPSPGNFTSSQVNFYTYYTEFGYNYTYLSPMPTQPNVQVSRSSTYFPNPSGTVMIGAKWANSENTSGSDWGTAFPGGILAAPSIDPPVCDPIPGYCLDGWASDGFYDKTLKLPLVAGANTGGNSYRYANQCTIGFLDGHSKSMSPGALAVGAYWSPTSTGSQQKITDYTKYLWGAIDNNGD